jgi:glycerol-1-phosphate dehydrogenase [NAD(P)+]
VIYEADAADRLPRVLAEAVDGRRVAVLMDVRTRDAAGGEVCGALTDAGWEVLAALARDPAPGHSPICDDMTKDKLAEEIGPVDAFVSVGSGVITDLTRWIAWERGQRFVSFATAASMNGYCSANVAPAINGVKTLLRTRPPLAVVSTPSVIQGAPYELTTSGLGDVLARSVSTADWRMNEIIFGDYFCPRAVALIAGIEPRYLEHPEDVEAGDSDALEALFQALLLTGTAMTMAGTTSPCSGGEHAVSHALDMTAMARGLKHDLHGRQVGIGTVLTSELYRRVLAVESPEFLEPQESVDRSYWGDLTDVVAPEYAGKIERLHQAVEVLSQGDAWDRLREGVAAIARAPEVTLDCLRRAGAAFRAEHIGCDGERLLAAFIHGHEMRPRFMILDLARLLGIMPAAAREIVETWT